MGRFSSLDGVLYCMPHFEQHFKKNGSYSSNKSQTCKFSITCLIYALVESSFLLRFMPMCSQPNTLFCCACNRCKTRIGKCLIPSLFFNEFFLIFFLKIYNYNITRDLHHKCLFVNT